MSTKSPKANVVEVLGLLMAQYNHELTDEQIRLHVRLLEDLPPEMLRQAALDHITDSQWFPRVAELRRRCVELQVAAAGLPSAYEAWELVMSQLRRAGSWGEWHFEHEAVARALRQIGGKTHLCTSTNLPADRARFVEAYQHILDSQRRELQQLPETREYVAQLAERYQQQQIEAGVNRLLGLMTGEKPS